MIFKKILLQILRICRYAYSGLGETIYYYGLYGFFVIHTTTTGLSETPYYYGYYGFVVICTTGLGQTTYYYGYVAMPTRPTPFVIKLSNKLTFNFCPSIEINIKLRSYIDYLYSKCLVHAFICTNALFLADIQLMPCILLINNQV